MLMGLDMTLITNLWSELSNQILKLSLIKLIVFYLCPLNCATIGYHSVDLAGAPSASIGMQACDLYIPPLGLHLKALDRN